MVEHESLPELCRRHGRYMSDCFIEFSRLEIGKIYVCDVRKGIRTILRRDENSTIECKINDKGEMESLIRHLSPTRDEEGRICYLGSELLYVRKEHQSAFNIFRELKEQLSVAEPINPRR